MARLPEIVFKDWKDGDVVTAYEYKREHNIIRTAVNDNYDLILNRYTKDEVNIISAELDADIKVNAGEIDVLKKKFPVKAEDVTIKDKSDKFVAKNVEDALLELAMYGGGRGGSFSTALDTVTLTTAATEIPITIPHYDIKDTLFVFKNSVYQYPNRDYERVDNKIISVSGATWVAGDVIDFIYFKTIMVPEVAGGVTSYFNEVWISNNTKNFHIGIDEFDAATDTLFVLQNGIMLYPETDYTYNSRTITKKIGTWNESKFLFIVLKTVYMPITKFDGDLISDGTIEEGKLSQQLLDRFTSIETQLAHIENKSFVADLLNYESYKVSTPNGDNYSPVLQYIHDMMPSSGGVIQVPIGVYNLFTNVQFSKSVTIRGCGFESELRISATLTAPTNAIKTFTLDQIKISNTGTNTALHIPMTTNSNKGYSNVLITNVYFYSESGKGILLKVKGIGESNISNCWFMSDVYNTYDELEVIGIYCDSDQDIGIANISIMHCQFTKLFKALHIDGAESNRVENCGYRFTSNMIIACVYGIYAKHVDSIQINLSMFDLVFNPIYLLDCNTLRIIGNYIGINENALNTAGIYIEAIAAQPMMIRHFDISSNTIGFYGVSNRANWGSAIYCKATNGRIQLGSIHDNELSGKYGLSLIGTSQYDGSIRNVKVFNNYSNDIVDIFINNNTYCTSLEICHNTAGSSVPAFITNITDTNIFKDNLWELSNDGGFRRSEQKGKLFATGDGTTKVFRTPHKLIRLPNWGSATIGSSSIVNLGMSISYDINDMIISFQTAPANGVEFVVNWYLTCTYD